MLKRMLKQSILRKPVVQPAIAIALGAIAGALCRYYWGLGMNRFLGIEVPYSTMVINVSGCFVMGVLATLSLGTVITIHPNLRLLLLTGFLGSYTTFSSYELDSARLLMQDRFVETGLYWAGSALLGLISAQLGIVLAEWLLAKLERNGSA